MLTFIPEIEIHNTVLSILKIVNDDFVSMQTAGTPDDSILYKMFAKDRCGNPLILNNFNWYEQAVEILINRNNNSPKKIEVFFGFNLERTKGSAIHILMPAESAESSAIGGNEGYCEPEENTDGTTQNIFTASIQTTYNLMITSNNSSEVILVYNFLKSMFLSLQTHLELIGYQNVTFGGSDVMFSPEFVPPHIFHRNFSISFSYDYDGISIERLPKVDSINLNYNLLNNQQC